MADSNCEKCAWREKYDTNRKSFLGRLWRWHIKFCPGWKKYMGSLDGEKKTEIEKKYNL